MCTSRSTCDSWLSIGKHEQLTRVHPVSRHPYWSSGSKAYLNCASPWLCLSRAQLSHQGESLAAAAVGLNGLFSCRGSYSSTVYRSGPVVDRHFCSSWWLGQLAQCRSGDSAYLDVSWRFL